MLWLFQWFNVFALFQKNKLIFQSLSFLWCPHWFNVYYQCNWIYSNICVNKWLNHQHINSAKLLSIVYEIMFTDNMYTWKNWALKYPWWKCLKYWYCMGSVVSLLSYEFVIKLFWCFMVKWLPKWTRNIFRRRIE